jgi:DNA mismatch repair protein MutS
MQEKTRLMQQYDTIKKEYQDVLLLFQVGDFYELFYQDAIKASSILGITLTNRGKSKNGTVPLCGVPVHTVDFYLKKLLDYGVKVAICNQLTESKPGSMSERGVVRVFTPGTLTDSNLLFDKSPSYLASVFKQDDSIALVFVELLTGTIEYTYFEQSLDKTLQVELSRFSPDEIIASQEMQEEIQQLFPRRFLFAGTKSDVIPEGFSDWLLHQEFVCKSDGYHSAIIPALKQLHSYLSYAYKQSLSQKYTFLYYQSEQYLMLDGMTIRNLDLVPTNKQQEQVTLFSILDDCVTPMGSRLLKKWILFPLNNRILIERRLCVVRFFFDNYQLLHIVRSLLSGLGDVERLVGRIALSKDTVSDYRKLLEVLSILPEFLSTIAPIKEVEHIVPVGRIQQCYSLEQLRLLLVSSIETNQDSAVIIKKGYSQELDDMRSLLHDIRANMLALEQKEQQNTGIHSLKIRYTPLHGYSIEITKNHLDKVPNTYKRLQTLSEKERYTNHELQQLELAIQQATIRVDILQKELFEHIRRETHNTVSLLRTVSFLFSYFDVVATLSFIAKERKYVQPELVDSGEIAISGGRHPVVEQLIRNRFITNDAFLSDQHFFMVLTGPNMGGKSTYLRQVALICIMAHVGSFVPALSAKIMLLDRVFTRIGAGDNISEGKSTFLVEMEEIATICSYATKKSLVILDEVGRGTATKDGISIAQAILEYLCSVVKARCLFATHYHELATLDYPHIISYKVESRKTGEAVVFLYIVTPGVAESSFGIEVLKMAKLPNSIIERAGLLLQQQSEFPGKKEILAKPELCVFHDEKIKKLEEKCAVFESVNVNDITAKQALDILFKVTSL